ncbi:DNA helicase II [Nitrococcus mobilis]|nr:DNA helicase II [Nitrococcus mobilis]
MESAIVDSSNLIDSLNAAQREAVTAPCGRTLVLAGAGSGKTRVLTHRAAWLLQAEEASAYSILAVTFTNKAAAEMRGRIAGLVGIAAGGMWIGTFHGLAHRLLRLHWREAGLPQHFQILDAEDQRRLIRRTLRNLEIDESRWPPRQIQGFINARKDEGRRPEALEPHDAYSEQMRQLYRAYEEACRAGGGLVDFAELLLRCYELLRHQPALLEHYRRRFRHILVDEFQDTNRIQYEWLRLLAGSESDVFIVGDDDQSIYGWRGAQVENMQRLQRDEPSTRVLRLEQNYRSTRTILAAANALIARNSRRLGKHLWTEGAAGEPIAVYAAFSEQDEARFVVERIRSLIESEGYARSDCAILYRSNAQSRAFEETLFGREIPYRVYGGLRFFERAEIKDALAYLRLLVNRNDDASFERVINTPPRGIGVKTLDALRSQARQRQTSLWQAAGELLRAGALSGRAARATTAFIELIDRLSGPLAEPALAARIEVVLAQCGLHEHYAKDRSERGLDRLENLDELISAARTFEQAREPTDDEADSLTAFLAHAALEAGEVQAGEQDDGVQLMTLHSAKGLEFPVVFLVGLEEGLFPHRMALDEPGRLEEERRLCYVGITRARQRLLLSFAERRRLHGQDHYGTASRFLLELPTELVQEVRARFSVTRPQTKVHAVEPMVTADTAAFSLGQRVRHATFGEGIVLSCEGSGPNTRVQVNFAHSGSKWLVAAYANLKPCP